MRKASVILAAKPKREKKKDPMLDEHWETPNDQVDALKKLVLKLRKKQ